MTDATGRFTIGGVPPGAYTRVVWHERLGRRERPLVVAPGERVTADVALPGGP